MDRVLTSALKLINFIKDHKLPVGAVALVSIMSLSGLTITGFFSSGGSTQPTPQAAVNAAQSASPSAELHDTASTKKPAAKENGNQSDTSSDTKDKPAANGGSTNQDQAAKPTSPSGQPKTSATTSLGPDAIKLVPHPESATQPEPLRYRLAYDVVRDGSFTGAVTVGGAIVAGPGKDQDILCGGTNAGSETVDVVINPTATNGTYTCSLRFDYGQTRFESRFKFDVDGNKVTFLPGVEIIPGKSL